MTPDYLTTQAQRDAQATRNGCYNHKLYDTLGDLYEALPDIFAVWSDPDRLAILAVALENCAPCDSETLAAFMDGFQLANAHAAAHGAIPGRCPP